VNSRALSPLSFLSRLSNVFDWQPSRQGLAITAFFAKEQTGLPDGGGTCAQAPTGRRVKEEEKLDKGRCAYRVINTEKHGLREAVAAQWQ
jgi:hypothetical protein